MQRTAPIFFKSAFCHRAFMPSFYIAIALSVFIAIAFVSSHIGPMLTFCTLLFSGATVSIAIQTKTGLSPLEQVVKLFTALTTRFVNIHKLA